MTRGRRQEGVDGRTMRGDDDKEDGQEAANEADDGKKNITINPWVNW